MAQRLPPKPLFPQPNPQKHDKTWQVLQMLSEFVTGAQYSTLIAPAVCIFGSARIAATDPLYAKAQHIATALSAAGFTVVTGGGPGIMEAANKGAFDGQNGLSIGLNIHLPHEQCPNGFQDLTLNFQHFAMRKMIFAEYARAYVIMAGGFGTLDELFTILVLMQTGKTPRLPIILVGEDFWQGLLQWLSTRLVATKTIAEEDLHLLTLCDEPQQIVQIIRDFCPAP